MKTPLRYSFSLILGCTILLGASSLHARSFGVSSASYGRGTMYTTSRGGQAYVGPRGVAAETANDRYGAATDRGAVVGGPNGAAAAGRYGAAAVTQNGAAVSTRYGAAAVARPGYGPLPAGYIRTVPTGYTIVTYGGYSCLFAGGIYYRPVIYGGETVYVVVP